jgi:hypothetical protein
MKMQSAMPSYWAVTATPGMYHRQIAEAFFGGIRAAIRANVESMPPPDLTAIADHFRRSYSAHFPDLAP